MKEQNKNKNENEYKSLLIVGHLLPQKCSHFEKRFLKNLYNKFNGSLKYVSINPAKISKIEIKKSILPDLYCKQLFVFRIPIFKELIRSIQFFFIMCGWILNTKNKDRIILIFNSPLDIVAPVFILRIFSNFKIFSYTIDTALSHIKNQSIVEKYYYNYFVLGEKLLNYFSGIIVLNEKVIDFLKIKIPYLVSKIGVDEDQLVEINTNRTNTNKKRVVYAGSLISYDGTEELLRAFTLLNKDKYVLHIYGSGPLEEIVKEYAEKYINIEYFGNISTDIIGQKMSECDLLINPRITGNITDYFGFPSKMIEYLLAKTPVLTTLFPAMPQEFLKFVHLIDEQSAEGIKNSIEKVFSITDEELRIKYMMGYTYVVNNNSYNKVIDEFLEFIDNPKYFCTSII